jgi:hypothetical protein
MTEAEIEKVCSLIQRGGKLYVGRDHVGRQKLKIIHGPFGLLTQRFRCSVEDFEALRHRLAGENKRSAGLH